MIHDRRDPVADLAEAVGTALLEFAARLREHPDRTAARPGEELAAAGESDGAAGGATGPDISRLGGTQARMMHALKAAGGDGLTASQVAELVGIKSTNAPRALRSLRERGLVSSNGERPEVWRAVEADVESV